MIVLLIVWILYREVIVFCDKVLGGFIFRWVIFIIGLFVVLFFWFEGIGGGWIWRMFICVNLLGDVILVLGDRGNIWVYVWILKFGLG